MNRAGSGTSGRPVPGESSSTAGRFWMAAALAVVLAGCATKGGYYEDDGPPRRHPVDIHSIPEPEPRDEPLSRTGNSPYVALGKRYEPMASARGYRERGVASWYGKKFHGRRTSSGETYDMFAMTAAHRTLPLPSYARVTNLRNGKSVVVRVNDRGPFLHNRVIDLSYAAAYKLGIVSKGTGRVEVVSIPGKPERASATGSGGSNSAPVREVSAGKRFFVQFGAFSRTSNAESLIRKLQENGIRFAHIQQGNDGYYRVLSGPFSSEATAEHYELQGADLGLNTTIVTE